MNLQQLRYLVAAADAGSLSGAARAERVSQPVVSRALHNLERELHVELFRRQGRQLALTDAGEPIVESARRALHAVEDVRRTAQRSARGAELVIAATPTNTKLLTPVFTSFLQQAPESALRLCRAAEMQEAITMVEHGTADLAFGEVEGRADTETLGYVALWDADVVVIAPTGNGLPASIPRAQLAELRLVLPPERSERRTLIDEFVAAAGGQRPSPVLATDERSAWIASAQQGIGAFVSYRAAAADLHQVHTIELDPPLHVVVGFVHRQADVSPDAREFLALSRECAPPAGCRARQEHGRAG
jgi:LysR family cyn operon transcriptional activator